MRMLRLMLFPFAVVYRIVTEARNRMYDLELKPAAKFDLPVISVGNLAVGGTGKTPMTEHLIRMLKGSLKIATLSRGYGRSSRGIRIAGAGDAAESVGDEPWQFYKKFGGEIVVAVGEDRALAITHILQEHDDVNVILMDDAFQHRRVQPSFQVLLTAYQNPFFNDYLLPAGRLREARKNADRADVVVVTKCPPEISEEQMIDIEARVRTYTDKPVFFASLHYGALTPFAASPTAERDNAVLVSGLADARPLETFVAANYKLTRHYNFADHHHYDEKELRMICSFADDHNAFIITTEKDAAKIGSAAFREFYERTPFFYLPIETEFLKNGEDFDAMVLNAVRNAR